MKKKILCATGFVMTLCLAWGVTTVMKPATAGAATDSVKFTSMFYNQGISDNLTEKNMDDFDYSQITAVEYKADSKAFEGMVYDESLSDNLMVENTDDFDYSQITVVEYKVGDNHFVSYAGTDKLENHILATVKGSYAPTSYWNLLNSPYQFTLVNMKNYAYTDYYFAPDSNNCLAIDFGTLTVVGDYFTVKLYETISQNCLGTWTGSRQENAGLGWTNLNPNKTYYFKFEAYSGTVNGSGFIMYD